MFYKGWTNAADPNLYVKRYLTRIIWLYGGFCLLFALQFIVPAFVKEGLTLGNMVLQIKIMVMAVFINGPYVHLWFVPPLLFGITFAYWLLRSNRTRLAAAIGITGFIACQFSSGSLRFLFEGAMNGFMGISLTQWDYVDQGLTQYFGFGVTFVVAGALIAKTETAFLKLPFRRLLLLLTALVMAELALLMSTSQWTTEYKLTLTLLPLTLLLFHGVLRIKSKHAIAHHLNAWLLGWNQVEMGMSQWIAQSLLTLLECLLFSYLIGWSLRKRRSKAEQRSILYY